jgi:hypothetical protein
MAEIDAWKPPAAGATSAAESDHASTTVASGAGSLSASRAGGRSLSRPGFLTITHQAGGSHAAGPFLTGCRAGPTLSRRHAPTLSARVSLTTTRVVGECRSGGALTADGRHKTRVVGMCRSRGLAACRHDGDAALLTADAAFDGARDTRLGWRRTKHGTALRQRSGRSTRGTAAGLPGIRSAGGRRIGRRRARGAPADRFHDLPASALDGR